MTEPMTDERLAGAKQIADRPDCPYVIALFLRELVAEIERLSEPFKDGIMIKKSTLAIWEKTDEQLEASKVEVERLTLLSSQLSDALSANSHQMKVRIARLIPAERFCEAALAMDSFDHHPDLLAWKEARDA